jgi:hypothetical protein
MKMGDKVSSDQQFWTWMALAISLTACVLLFFIVPANLKDEADDPWTSYKEAQGSRGSNYDNPVSEYGLTPTSSALVRSLDWHNEGDWHNRREAVNRLGWMVPSSQGEFDAITAHLKRSLDWHFEGDEDVRKAVLEALTNVEHNWKKSQGRA